MVGTCLGAVGIGVALLATPAAGADEPPVLPYVYRRVTPEGAAVVAEVPEQNSINMAYNLQAAQGGPTQLAMHVRADSSTASTGPAVLGWAGLWSFDSARRAGIASSSGFVERIDLDQRIVRDIVPIRGGDAFLLLAGARAPDIPADLALYVWAPGLAPQPIALLAETVVRASALPPLAGTDTELTVHAWDAAGRETDLRRYRLDLTTAVAGFPRAAAREPSPWRPPAPPTPSPPTAVTWETLCRSLEPGTYRLAEDTVRTTPCRIRGRDLVIDGAGHQLTGAPLILEVEHALIRGFHLTGGNSDRHGGIQLRPSPGGHVWIVSNRIEDERGPLEAGRFARAAISVEAQTSTGGIVVRNNVITGVGGDASQPDAMAIHVHARSDQRLAGLWVLENIVAGASTGGSAAIQVEGWVTRFVVSGNELDGYGGQGIAVVGGEEFLEGYPVDGRIVGNRLCGSRAEHAAIEIDGASRILVSHNVVGRSALAVNVGMTHRSVVEQVAVVENVLSPEGPSGSVGLQWVRKGRLEAIEVARNRVDEAFPADAPYVPKRPKRGKPEPAALALEAPIPFPAVPDPCPAATP